MNSNQSNLRLHCCFGVVHVRLAALIHAAVQFLSLSGLFLMLICYFVSPQLAQVHSFSIAATTCKLLSLSQNDIFSLRLDEKSASSTPQPNESTLSLKPSLPSLSDSRSDFIEEDDALRRLYVKSAKPNEQAPDLLIFFILNVLSLAFAAMMVLGIALGKSQFIPPFFCLQILDFVIICITVVSQVTQFQDRRRLYAQPSSSLIARNLFLPPSLQDSLTDSFRIMLLMLSLCVLLPLYKLYFLLIVWQAYRFLLRKSAGLEMLSGFLILYPSNCAALMRILTGSLTREVDISDLSVQSVSLCGLLSRETETDAHFAQWMRQERQAQLGEFARATSTNQDSQGELESTPLLGGNFVETNLSMALGPDSLLPSYEDTLKNPANANMPPPYFK